MTLPNFLVIGAAKAGTTSVYNYVRQHPEIFMSPVKEPGFFLHASTPLEAEPAARGRLEHVRRMHARLRPEFVLEHEGYERLFRGVRAEKAIGEATPTYLCSPSAARRIKHYVPHAKLIAILRDPVARAYSDYWQAARGRRRAVHSSFAQAIAAEDPSAPLPDGWEEDTRVIRDGFYYQHLRRYLELFDRAQLLVLLYEDLARRPHDLLREVFAFLGVDAAIVPDTAQAHNVGGAPRDSRLYRLLTPLNPSIKATTRLLPRAIRRAVVRFKERYLLDATPPVDPALRRRLVPVFRDDICKLQDLIGRDLSPWLVVS